MKRELENTHHYDDDDGQTLKSSAIDKSNRVDCGDYDYEHHLVGVPVMDYGILDD